MIVGKQADNEEYVIATRDSEGSYAMIYFPTGKSADLDLSSLNGSSFDTWWFDPRTGVAFPGDLIKKGKEISMRPPSSGIGSDWVLVIDEAQKEFGKPGIIK